MPSQLNNNRTVHSYLYRVARLFAAVLVLLSTGVGHADRLVRPLIVGGYETTPGAWPWMAGLLSSWEPNNYWAQYCGGSLIHSQWVLTAAHCLVDDNGFVESPQNLDVVVGAHNLSSNEGTRVGTSKLVVHSGFNKNTLVNDIALIKLDEPLSVTPVQLPGVSVDQFVFGEGRDAELLGWGATTPWGTGAADDLQQVSLQVGSQSSCAQWWSPTEITDGMVCLWTGSGGKDTCVGDSGGPALAWANGRWEQLGITSFGEAGACAQPYSYGVYTRVSRYTSWISSQVCTPDELPSKPVITVQLQGNRASLSIDSGSASNHRLYYAPAPLMTPIAYVDLGSARQFSVDLPSGADYYAAVQGYDGVCQGSVSETQRITVP